MKWFGNSLLLACAMWSSLQVSVSNAEERLPDVRLLIDVSGSMRQSDPQNLRAPALDLMVQLLPEGSRAGVWVFGQYVNMVVDHGEVNEQWRQQALQAVEEISNFGLLTNIPDALEMATFDIERLGDRYHTSIILLTDGKVEVSESATDNRRAALDLLENVAPGLRDRGVTVHTIALSGEADWEFLRSLAQVTGGLAERAESAEQLSAVFLQALDIAAPTEQVPLLGGEFLVDESVEEFTVLVFPDADTEGVTLLDPAGNALQRETVPAGTNWYHHDRFELITVSDPQDGEWRIVAPGSIARVNVISHLSLELDRLPTTMPSGHKPEFGMRLVDSDVVIADQDLLQLLTVSVKIVSADDRKWELTLTGEEADSSGEFRIELPMLAEAGRYELVLHVDGRSFQREVSFVTDVVDPAPELDSAAAVPAELPKQGMPGWLLPAGVSMVLLLGLLFWVFRRRQQEEWSEDDDDVEDDVEDDVADSEEYFSVDDIEYESGEGFSSQDVADFSDQDEEDLSSPDEEDDSRN
jgi:Mg-chelatase subunit ChlD